MGHEMIYYLIEKNEGSNYDIILKDHNCENILKYLNPILVEMSKNDTYSSYSDMFKDYIHKQTLVLSWEIENRGIALGYFLNDDILKIEEGINKDVFSEIIKDNIAYLLKPEHEIGKWFENKDGILRPEKLCNLLFSKCLTDPHGLLKGVLGIDDTYFHRAFIYFLNRCLEGADKIEKPELNNIVLDFTGNCDTNQEINRDVYDKLLMFYMMNKKLEPFCVKYKKYISLAE